MRVPARVPHGTVIPFKLSLCEVNYLFYNQPPPSCGASHKDVEFNITVRNIFFLDRQFVKKKYSTFFAKSLPFSY